MVFDSVARPFFTVLISPSNPVAANATVRAAVSAVVSSTRDISDKITNFEFEDSEKELDVLRLTLDNYELSLFDDPLYSEGNLVTFQFGYPGRVFGPRTHFIESITSQGLETMIISCLPMAATTNEQITFTWKDSNIFKVITEYSSNKLIKGVETYNIDPALISMPKRDLVQSSQTYIQFLRRLAKEIGYEVYIEGDTLYVEKKRYGDRPVREYVWRTGSRGELMDFNIESTSTVDRAAEIEMASHDPIEKTANESQTGSDSETERETQGSQSTLVLRPDTVGTLIAGKRTIPTPNPDKKAVKMEADARYRRQEEIDVKATAEIIGDPLLGAKSNISVLGISRRYSGIYYVEKHTHKISSDGYTGSLDLHRNAVGDVPASPTPETDKTKAKENTSSVKTDPRLILSPNEQGDLLVQRG